MIAGLERFVERLRAEGVPASTAEWLDALRAVEAVGVEDRERFRAALRCTLAKRGRAQAAFDRAFEAGFPVPARGTRRGRGRRGAAGGAAPGGSGSRAGAATARGAASLRRPADEPSGRRRPARSPAASEAREAGALRRELRSLVDGLGAPRGRLRHLLAALEPAAASAADLRGRMSVEEERALADAVPRVVERLRLREARRLKRSTRGELDLRGLFRDNVSRGGVPFVLPRRVRRRRHPRVVLLVDVSWSTARAAGLFLSIAGAFVARHRDVRVHAFVDRAVDASAAVTRWLTRRPASAGVGRAAPTRAAPGAGIVRGGVSFADVLGGLGGLNLDAPSDYGRAFHGLLARGALPRGRGSVLVVLGDGRVNRFDPQAWAFEELARGRGAVLWLVPERFAEWGEGDSALQDYLPQCDVAVEARDLDGLARGVAELVRRL